MTVRIQSKHRDRNAGSVLRRFWAKNCQQLADYLESLRVAEVMSGGGLKHLRREVRRFEFAMSIARPVVVPRWRKRLRHPLRRIRQAGGFVRDWERIGRRLATDPRLSVPCQATHTFLATYCLVNLQRAQRDHLHALKTLPRLERDLRKAAKQVRSRRKMDRSTAQYGVDFLQACRASLRQRMEGAEGGSLHATRTQVKKLRCCLEFMPGCHPPERGKQELRILRHLQARMGQTHDWVILRRHLAVALRLLRETRTAASPWLCLNPGSLESMLRHSDGLRVEAQAACGVAINSWLAFDGVSQPALLRTEDAAWASRRARQGLSPEENRRPFTTMADWEPAFESSVATVLSGLNVPESDAWAVSLSIADGILQ